MRIGLISLIVLFTPLSLLADPIGVAFPGANPGAARVNIAKQTATLENNALSATWTTDKDGLRLSTITNQLTQASNSQQGTELFRIATQPPTAEANGVYVGIRLDDAKISVEVSSDGNAWTKVSTYPRKDFEGDPQLIRIGKMNTKAEAKDNPGDLGADGECAIDHLSPAIASIVDGSWAIKAKAHQATIHEAAFPTGTTFISCHIDKQTDQGMSWGPAIALVWDDGQKYVLAGVREKNNVFNLSTPSGEVIKAMKTAPSPTYDLLASQFKVVSKPILVSLNADLHGVRVADRVGGKALEAELLSDRGVQAHWRAELRDGSNYIRQSVTFSIGSDVVFPVFAVQLLDLKIPGCETIGSVPGSPVAGSGMFAGVEMPGAENALNDPTILIGFSCKLELSKAQPYSFGSVVGVAPQGQLRRSFLYYIERERARPSKPFLHYNCWYDLGFNTSEAKMLDVVDAFNTELVHKRGVPVQSYLLDDGWDDVHKGLWAENTKHFPNGLAGLNEKMAKVGAHLSVWISPLGGYGGNEERTKLAQSLGLIPEGSHLDLSQPAYKKWFQERCLTLMRDCGVNAFKWDKAGEGVSPHFMALLDVARNLRKQNPEVFINVTVGTWPSPFWLNHVDCTWRNGAADVGWAGVGDDREKWLTFRDGYCHRLFVEASPLYPLNSVMHHGIVHGRAFQGERVGKAGSDLKNEARSYFSNGATLQELYLTPSMMTQDGWDRVAEAAKWSHANSDVLLDTHWVGGDPLKLQAYGYAAWNARKGTLMLRNPDDKPQTIQINAQATFDLPAGAAQNYQLKSPYKDQRLQTLHLHGQEAQSITLEAFEVVVFDALPE